MKAAQFFFRSYNFVASLALVFFASTMLASCNGEGGVMGTPSTPGSSSSGARCSDYATQAAAQAAHNSGVKGLDADGDGLACEELK